MAELTLLGYQPGSTCLHHIDSRLKLAGMALFSLVILSTGFYGLSIFTVFTVLLFRCGGLRIRTIVSETRYFLLLIGLIFIARALSTPGTVVWTAATVSVTREGLLDGLKVCWRLSDIVMAGLLLITTSRPADIRSAVIWFLTPVPLIPAKRVATMIGLVMRFVPVIFNQIKETADAQRARGIENRKNPIFRLKKLGVPLIWRTFDRADKLVDAMEARGYNDNRTGPSFSFGHRDKTALFIIVAMSLVVSFL